MPLKRITAGDDHRVIDPAQVEGSESSRKRSPTFQGKVTGKGRRVKFQEAFPIQEIHREDPDERTSHMNVPLGWAVLDHVFHQRASAWSSRDDKMCMMHQASLMTAPPAFVGNDHLLPKGSSIHLYLGDCWLEIPSRGIKVKLMVTTSNHVSVNMAHFGDDLEIERRGVGCETIS